MEGILHQELVHVQELGLCELSYNILLWAVYGDDKISGQMCF